MFSYGVIVFFAAKIDIIEVSRFIIIFTFVDKSVRQENRQILSYLFWLCISSKVVFVQCQELVLNWECISTYLEKLFLQKFSQLYFHLINIFSLDMASRSLRVGLYSVCSPHRINRVFHVI